MASARRAAKIDRENTIILPVLALLAEASHRLALAQHYQRLDMADDGVEFANIALTRLQAEKGLHNAHPLAEHVTNAREWVIELSEDVPDALRWDRDIDCRMGLLRTELDEIFTLAESQADTAAIAGLIVATGTLTAIEAADAATSAGKVEWLTPAATPEPRRRQRKPTLASVAKQASKAALEVARYEVRPDGTVVVVTGKSEKSTEPNPWLDDLKVTKQ
jgi:hypothetical protein